MEVSRSIQHELSAEEMLEIILDYAAKISGENDLDTLLILMAEMGRELVRADRCTLWLVDHEKNRLWTKVAHGIDRIDMPADSGLAGYSIQTGKNVLVKDAYKDKRFNPAIDKKTNYRTRSVLCIPIRSFDQETIGVYQTIHKGPDWFSEKDAKKLSLAASYTGKSIQAAILHSELVETQREIIFKIGEVSESRSRETGQHVKRVAKYSRALAKLAGLPESEAQILELASPMHDIGKVAIPDHILKKPGKLTVEEYSIMQTHTTEGYNIFKSSTRRIFKAAAVIAYEHHEKWDGTGYPRGLKGEEIHLYARITAIADVFDALGSSRVYKKAWPLHQIVQFIDEGRGRHFDPNLANLFLDNLEIFMAIRKQYEDSF
ncbi:HD domain-containing phosphohydrolase [Domibacillus iocasae]|uniref:Histidine kinase n=1 Tax=Domibacillus iocasae TaxID=1714016 RepID=A0A1E7DK88_9BACI|nr:HD domain-containing phosphohydrolase [Domibacillus iocasae]OES43473.1 histidine kinase [Domibacillus iocasae]